MLDQPLSSQRYQEQPRDDEAALVKRMLELVRQQPRFGYRPIGRLLRREGWLEKAQRPNERWGTDLMYVRIGSSQYYLVRFGMNTHATWFIGSC